MAQLTTGEVDRLARLARLALSPEEATRLASEVAGIATAFEGLAAYAASLPEPAPPEPGALRPDAAVAAPDETVDGILRAVPDLDAPTRLVKVPRGQP